MAVILAFLGLLVALLPAACGKRGDLELPEGESDQFPHQYPNPDEV
jgi:predicted small lipoprotein YifL